MTTSSAHDANASDYFTSDGEEIIVGPDYAAVFLSKNKKRFGIRLRLRSTGIRPIVWLDPQALPELIVAMQRLQIRLEEANAPAANS